MSKKTKDKIKGNRFERECSVLLNKWIFNGEKILKRADDSGALKDIYTGDIIPYGQLPPEWEGKFPFHIECKSGYKDCIPTPFTCTTIQKWLVKCIEESKIHNQFNILLLVRFFNRRKILLITNKYISDSIFTMCIPIQYEDIYVFFYFYFIEDLQTKSFFKCFDLKELY